MTTGAETREVLAWLRRHRGSTGAMARKLGYAVYLVVLFVAIYGWPVIQWAARSLGTTHVRAAVGIDVVRGLPMGLAAVFALVVLGACRNALWRGPVAVSEADVVWLLPTPLDRGRILRPRAAVALGAAAVVGALAGALGALFVHAVEPHSGGRLVVGMVAFGVATATSAVSLSTFVESSGPAARVVRRLSLPASAVVIALASLTWLRATGHSRPWVDRVALWAGPWGWAAQLAAASDRASNHLVPIALVLLAAFTIAGVGLALRQVAGLPAEALHSRARLDRRLASDLNMGDARSARLAVRAARSSGARSTRRHLRVPRSARLVIVWRDLTALLRAPGRVAWAGGFVAAATAIVGIGVAASATHDPAPAAVLVAVLAGYLAAAALLEVARVDHDRPELASQLPFRRPNLARRHVVVATAVVGGFGAIAAAVAGARLGASPVACAAAAIAVAPMFVVAASIKAYQSAPPIEFMLADAYGLGTALVVLSMLVGPIVALVTVGSAAVPIFSALRSGTEPSSALAGFLVTCALWMSVELWILGLVARGRTRAAA